MAKFTIKTRCHIYGTEHTYRVSFGSSAELIRWFDKRPDSLLSFKAGWDFSETIHHAMRLHKLVPDPIRFSKIPEMMAHFRDFDWREQEDFW